MPFSLGIKRLSQLVIDAVKDWGGKRIDNVGAPNTDDDVPRARAGDVLSGRFGMARMPDGTSGFFLRAGGAGVDPVYAEAPRPYAAGSTALASADIEVTNTNTGWVKYKQIKIGKGGVLSTSFDLHISDSANWAQAQIRCNGVAVGTFRQTNSVTYQTYTENINVIVGDSVELWLSVGNSAYTTYARNFRLTTDHSATATARVEMN